MPVLLKVEKNANRWCHLWPNDLLYRVSNTTNSVALTFDDGPEPVRTEALLDVLKKHHVHATFFVLGKKAKEHPEIIRRMIEEGHSVGSHTYSHRRFSTLSDTDMQKELTETNSVLAKVGARPVNLLRPPGGDISIRKYRWVKSRFPQRICMWSISTADWKYKGISPTAEIVENIIKKIQSGDIILAHDWAITPETLSELLSALESRGYTFVSLDAAQ